MRELDKISISQIIWYFLPGLALLTFLFFTLGVLNLELFIKIIDTIGLFGTIFMSLIFGSIMDGLRLYRIRPGYFKIKKEFHNEISNILGPELNPYYTFWKLSKFASNNGYEQIPFLHSFWIFLAQLTFLCWIAVSFWLFITIYLLFCKPNILLLGYEIVYPYNFLICLGITILFLVIGIRILFSSIEDQMKTNSMFLDLAKEHKFKIMGN